MSKFSNSILFLSGLISIGYLLLFGAHDAVAQYVTSLGQAPSQVRLCPNRKCLQIFEHSFVRGKKIIIFEKKNGWVRLSGTIAPEQLQARFPDKKGLPDNAAYWIPSADLPPAIATQFHSEEIKPETDKQPKPVVYAKLPRVAPLPTSRPEHQVAVKTDNDTPKVAPIAKPAVAENKQEQKPAEPKAQSVPNPVEPAVKKEETASTDQGKEPEIKLAAVEAKSELEVETDSFGNPIVKLPSKLTKKLKDKRLAKLPRKPKSGLDLKSVIAIRYHGLRLLNDGSCKAIREGGKSLSLAGWIFVICEDDGQYRQFPVE